jgi:hypothetical protein
MGFKIVFTKPAISDVEALVTHISRDNPKAAEPFGYAIIAKAEIWLNFLCWAGWCLNLKMKASGKPSIGLIESFIVCEMNRNQWRFCGSGTPPEEYRTSRNNSSI